MLSLWLVHWPAASCVTRRLFREDTSFSYTCFLFLQRCKQTCLTASPFQPCPASDFLSHRKPELPHCGFPSITLMFKWLNEQPTWTSWNRIRFEWALHFSSAIFFWSFNVAHLSYSFVKVIYAYYFKSCKNREKWGEWKLY